MFTWRGHIASGTVDSVGSNLATVIDSFLLVNKSGGSIVTNVYVISGADVLSISPFGNTINAGAIYKEADMKFTLNANDVVRLVTNGSTDYWFEMNNTQAPET
jgi:hypothetical protein